MYSKKAAHDKTYGNLVADFTKNNAGKELNAEKLGENFDFNIFY